jgi:hypothetical protein
LPGTQPIPTQAGTNFGFQYGPTHIIISSSSSSNNNNNDNNDNNNNSSSSTTCLGFMCRQNVIPRALAEPSSRLVRNPTSTWLPFPFQHSLVSPIFDLDQPSISRPS